MSSLERAFRDHVRAGTRHDLTRWLLRGCENGDFAPLYLAPDPSPSIQLENLSRRVGEEERDKLVQALIYALVEWRPEIYRSRCLEELACLAAYLQSGSAVGIIRSILEGGILAGLDEEGRQEATETIIGVLHGFAALEEVRELFERLFFSDDFDPQFAAQLFLGLCSSAPGRFWRYVPRFMSLSTRYPDYYDIPYVITEVVSVVTLTTIADGLGRIMAPDRERFLHLLACSPWSPAFLGNSPRDGLILSGRDSGQQAPVVIDLDNDLLEDDQFLRLKDKEANEMGALGMVAYIIDTSD